MIYYYEKNDSNQKISLTCKLFTITVWSGFISLLCMEKYNVYRPYINKDRITFNSLVYLGNCKVLSTLVKFLPQVIYNFQRKSTVGWSVYNVLFDFYGSMFCLCQSFLETYITNRIDNKNKINSVNIAKYGLGTISLIYDSIFIIQHYCLYKENDLNEQLNEENNKDAIEESELASGKKFQSNVAEKENKRNPSVQFSNLSFASRDPVINNV